jgi:hypothetical protein
MELIAFRRLGSNKARKEYFAAVIRGDQELFVELQQEH